VSVISEPYDLPSRRAGVKFDTEESSYLAPKSAAYIADGFMGSKTRGPTEKARTICAVF
jgi:hypothetical protein